MRSNLSPQGAIATAFYIFYRLRFPFSPVIPGSDHSHKFGQFVCAFAPFASLPLCAKILLCAPQLPSPTLLPNPSSFSMATAPFARFGFGAGSTGPGNGSSTCRSSQKQSRRAFRNSKSTKTCATCCRRQPSTQKNIQHSTSLSCASRTTQCQHRFPWGEYSSCSATTGCSRHARSSKSGVASLEIAM